jgi:hypothetical protein
MVGVKASEAPPNIVWSAMAAAPDDPDMIAYCANIQRLLNGKHKLERMYDTEPDFEVARVCAHADVRANVVVAAQALSAHERRRAQVPQSRIDAYNDNPNAPLDMNKKLTIDALSATNDAERKAFNEEVRGAAPAHACAAPAAQRCILNAIRQCVYPGYVCGLIPLEQEMCTMKNINKKRLIVWNDFANEVLARAFSACRQGRAFAQRGHAAPRARAA